MVRVTHCVFAWKSVCAWESFHIGNLGRWIANFVVSLVARLARHSSEALVLLPLGSVLEELVALWVVRAISTLRGFGLAPAHFPVCFLADWVWIDFAVASAEGNLGVKHRDVAHLGYFAFFRCTSSGVSSGRFLLADAC